MPNRRDFLKRFTLLSTSVWAPSFLVNSIKAAQAAGLSKADPGGPERILIVIELMGGVDGLNTCIPYTDDAYFAARPLLAVRQNQGLLTLDDRLAFHPAMTGLKALWDDGNLSIVNGVGYPNPNRSHFRARDIWHTAKPEQAAKDGWLAGYLGSLGSDSSLAGINIGGRVPRAMISEDGSSPSIQNISTYQLQTDPKYPRDANNKDSTFQQILSEAQNRYAVQEYVSQTILDATVSSVQLLEGRQDYESSVVYPETVFAANLRSIAQIITAEVGVRVFYTSISGFDTHSNQVVGGDSAQGTHAALLADVSESIKAFYDDLVEMGRVQDVLILTLSEFGRRLNENGSLGTDHGTANQMFLVGGAVNPGMFGRQPGLAPAELDPIGDMIFTTDFRSVYASVLTHWLGTDAAQILGADWLDPSLAFV